MQDGHERKLSSSHKGRRKNTAESKVLEREHRPENSV